MGTSKVGATSKAKKFKVFKICPGSFYEKLTKPFRDTQRVPFMLDKTRKPRFPQLEKFLKQNLIFFFRKMSDSAENPSSPLCS